MNIIEELYFGNINPNEKCFESNSKYAVLIKTISENEEKLTTYLSSLSESKEEHLLFSQLLNANSEVLRISELDKFIEGFQLGARFILDTFLLPQ